MGDESKTLSPSTDASLALLGALLRHCNVAEANLGKPSKKKVPKMGKSKRIGGSLLKIKKSKSQNVDYFYCNAANSAKDTFIEC